MFAYLGPHIKVKRVVVLATKPSSDSNFHLYTWGIFLDTCMIIGKTKIIINFFLGDAKLPFWFAMQEKN